MNYRKVASSRLSWLVAHLQRGILRPNNKHELPRVATILQFLKRQVQCACPIIKVSTVACSSYILISDCGKILAGRTDAPQQ